MNDRARQLKEQSDYLIDLKGQYNLFLLPHPPNTPPYPDPTYQSNPSYTNRFVHVNASLGSITNAILKEERTVFTKIQHCYILSLTFSFLRTGLSWSVCPTALWKGVKLLITLPKSYFSSQNVS